jgi:hypothetical protein
VTAEQKLAIVALHSWLEIGDHDANGHNFLRGGASLFSIDHCTALSRILNDPAADPAVTTLVDPGALVIGVPLDDPARQTLRERIMSIRREDIEAIAAQFPDDPLHPWLSVEHRAVLVNWILARQGGAGNVIAS